MFRSSETPTPVVDTESAVLTELIDEMISNLLDGKKEQIAHFAAALWKFNADNPEHVAYVEKLGKKLNAYAEMDPGTYGAWCDNVASLQRDWSKTGEPDEDLDEDLPF